MLSLQHWIDTYGLEDYLEWRDFYVDDIEQQDNRMIFREFYFKDMQGHLLGYMKFNIEKNDKDPCVYIIDTTSSTGYKHFSPESQDMYKRNGYVPGNDKKWFGKIAFSYVLAYLKEQYPKVRIVLVCAYTHRESKVWDLIDRVSESTKWLITNISWGNDMHMATIFLK